MIFKHQCGETPTTLGNEQFPEEIQKLGVAQKLVEYWPGIDEAMGLVPSTA